MSRLLSSDDGAIEMVGVGTLAHMPESGGFRARFDEGAGGPPLARSGSAPTRSDPVEQARADGFAQGFDEGVHVATEALAAELDNRERLTAALEQLGPAGDGALSSLLSSAVMRLVGQIVGASAIDPDLLRTRCERVAAFIEEGQAKSALYVNPDDASLIGDFALGIALQTDTSIPRGCVRLDTADGWIEDGPDVQLARLQAMFDDMEGRA